MPESRRLALSQSHVAKQRRHDTSGDLTKLDLLYAVLFHVLVLTIVIVLGFWQSHRTEEPLKRIEVMMISAADLSKLEQQSRRKAKPVKKEKVKQKAKPKPKKVVKAKPKVKPKLQPVAKPVTAKAKPKKKQAKAVAKVDPDFDPFAPVSSTTDRSQSTKKASTSRPEQLNLVGQQLSKSELERYIALMQAAVQEHWKVPSSTDNTSNPLVQMELARTGAVVSVKIIESSGNETIDASLIRAIYSAAPFELPRQQFEYFRQNLIRFHPFK